MAPARAALLALIFLSAGCLQGGGGEGSGRGQDGNTTAPPPPPEGPDGNGTEEEEDWGWVRQSCPDAGPGPAPEVPGVLLTFPDRTVLLRPDGNGSFEETASAPSPMRSAVALGGFLYGIEPLGPEEEDGKAVVKRSLQLQEQGRVAFADVGDLAAAEGTLWMVNRWNLTAFDPGLQEMGRASLQLPYHLYKQPDGVEVHDGTAYVLDDVALPFVVFRVDVSDPHAMEVLERRESSSSSSPSFQWLAPDGTWYVESGFFGMGGGQQTVESYPPDGEAGHIPLYKLSYQWGDGRQDPVEEGFSVRDATFLLPAWAWLSGNGTQLLAKVDVDGDVPVLSCETEMTMELSLSPDPFVRRDGDVVVVAHGFAVQAYDVRSAPVFLASLGLDEPVQGLSLVPGL